MLLLTSLGVCRLTVVFILRLKLMNKGKWPGRLKKVASRFALSVFLSSKTLFARHFAAEEQRHVCCRVPVHQAVLYCCHGGSLRWCMCMLIFLMEEDHPRLTFVLCRPFPWPVSLTQWVSATGAGANGDFSSNWKK